MAEARVIYREELGVDAEMKRLRAIEQLPVVMWHGERLYTIRCKGDFGNGPHDMNVPESLLWSLITLEWFLCPYHR